MDSAVRVQGLTKRYGRRTVLRDVSFRVAPGSVVALLGGNGAGKTTTLKCMLGIAPFEGEIEVEGLSVARHGREVRARIGYVPQVGSLPEDETCERVLAFVADLRGAPVSRVPEALATVGLEDDAGMRVGELSGGMRQRLALAAALIGQPRLLLLDEPAASLDIAHRTELMETIARLRDEGRTVILSRHHFDRLEDLADQVLVLRDGAVAFDGTVAELAKRVRGRRVVVHLNGDAPAAFLRTLDTAGIPRERVSEAPLPWEDVLQMDAPEREEQKR
jgi:ABC-type multidrug transport system ATPase subunit